MWLEDGHVTSRNDREMELYSVQTFFEMLHSDAWLAVSPVSS